MATFSKQTTLSHLQNAGEPEEEEGQWKNLPTDILALLLRRFHTKPDLCRFRSICKSWRSFATPIQPHLLFPLTLPPLSPGTHSFSLPLSLSPQFLYIFSPNSTHNNNSNNNDRWITKVVEISNTNNSNNKWLALNPLTNRRPFTHLPRVCKNGLNLLGFRNHEVGRSYRTQIVWGDDTLKKAVVLTNDTVSVLGLSKDGQIVLWNHGDQNWNVIDTSKEKNNYGFDDIICFHGKFYAVDRIGRLVMINPGNMEVAELISSRMDSCSIQLSSYSVECSSKMGCYSYDIHSSYLVESDFRLYMVTKIVNIPVYLDDEVEVEEELVVKILESSVGKKPHKFRVYVLSEREMCWERVASLGNKVFFLSFDTVFSANAADLGLSMGNCIYFGGVEDSDGVASIFTLEDGAVVICDSTVDHRTRILYPPMAWFVQNEEYPEWEMQDQSIPWLPRSSYFPMCRN